MHSKVGITSTLPYTWLLHMTYQSAQWFISSTGVIMPNPSTYCKAGPDAKHLKYAQRQRMVLQFA